MTDHVSAIAVGCEMCIYVNRFRSEALSMERVVA